jgi:hypothetical protein
MKHGIVAAALVLALAGCVGTNSAGTVTAIDLPPHLAAITLADLDAADADAKAHGDGVAAMCYEALIPLIGAAQAPAAPVGLVSGFQELRDGVNGGLAARGLLKQLEVPCGPLAADVNLTLVALVAKFAGAAVPGAAPFSLPF